MNISRNVLLAASVTFGFNVVADDKPATQPTRENVTPAEKKQAESSFFGTVASVVCFPITFTRDTTLGLTDWVAGTFGAEAFTNWLGAASKDKEGKDTRGTIATFFNDHATGAKRVFTAAEVAVVAYAACEAYKAFVAE